MRSTFVIGGTIGLGLVLIAGLVSGLAWLASPARMAPASKLPVFPTPEAQIPPGAAIGGSQPGTAAQQSQIDLIRGIVGKPDLQLTYDSERPLANAPSRPAVVYMDSSGSKYYIDVRTGRLAAIEPGLTSHPVVPDDQSKSVDELRGIATSFAQANSPRLAELNKSLAYEEGCKESLCFFRWDARNLPTDWSGTDWAIMPPFLQVGLLTDGDMLSYYDTLDLFEETAPEVPPQPTPEAVLGGGKVQDGPFTFDLRLYRDPQLTSQPLAPSLYTDMEGFGAYTYWSYNASEVIGPVTTYWGIESHLEQLLQATYSSAANGSTGGRSGGILLPGGPLVPGNSQVGDRERLVLKVVTPNGSYGGVLLFTLIQGPSGFEPTDISLEVLQGS